MTRNFKAFQCPQCGFQTTSSDKRTCTECGYNGDWIQPGEIMTYGEKKTRLGNGDLAVRAINEKGEFADESRNH